MITKPKSVISKCPWEMPKTKALFSVQAGEVVLTEAGRQFAADRAGRQIEQIESKDAGGSCLDQGSQAALSKLEHATRGKFLSAHLPSILHGHIDGKAPSFEIMQELTKATGASPELLEGMMSEIATKALDFWSPGCGSQRGPDRCTGPQDDRGFQQRNQEALAGGCDRGRYTDCSAAGQSTSPEGYQISTALLPECRSGSCCDAVPCSNLNLALCAF
jgi:hypothetical protein